MPTNKKLPPSNHALAGSDRAGGSQTLSEDWVMRSRLCEARTVGKICEPGLSTRFLRDIPWYGKMVVIPSRVCGPRALKAVICTAKDSRAVDVAAD